MTPAIRKLAAITAAACLGAIALAAHADPAGKWRVKFGGHADNDGILTLKVSPDGGAPVDVETKVAKGTGADRTARAVRDSLKASLGDGYKIETDDGEDVVIKAKGDTAKFDVTLGSSTLTGTKIDIEKE